MRAGECEHRRTKADEGGECEQGWAKGRRAMAGAGAAAVVNIYDKIFFE
jgi:hypothetical protein